MEFFKDLAQFQFLQFALLAAILSSVVSGVVGSIIVVRRSTYVAGAIAHSVLGGMGLAKYIEVVHNSQIWGIEFSWLTPTVGALLASITAASLIALATTYAKERIDSILSIIWALGMAIGITFILKTPGNSEDLMSYLAGSILMVSKGDLLLMFILDIAILTIVYLFYNPILTVCFNEESAKVQGIPVTLYNFLILISTALTTVLLSQIVGVVMVIALLSIPAAIASRFTVRLSSLMIGTALVSLFVSVSGLIVSYGPELPVGATIIEIAGVLYLIALFVKGRNS